MSTESRDCSLDWMVYFRKNVSITRVRNACVFSKNEKKKNPLNLEGMSIYGSRFGVHRNGNIDHEELKLCRIQYFLSNNFRQATFANSAKGYVRVVSAVRRGKGSGKNKNPLVLFDQ